MSLRSDKIQKVGANNARAMNSVLKQVNSLNVN